LFGIRQVVIKYVAIAKSKKQYQEIYSTVKVSLLFNGMLSLIIAAIGAICLPWVVQLFSGNQDLYYPLVIGYFMLIPQTLARVFASALNGFGKIWQSNLVDQALSSIILLIGLATFWMLNIPFTTINALLLYASSRVLQLGIIWLVWKNYFKYQNDNKVQLKLQPLLKMGLPMLLVSSTVVLASNIDSIMLGSLASMHELGLYSVAARVALLNSFFLTVSNSAIGPKIAKLYSDNSIIDLTIMVKKTTKTLIYIAFFSVLIFVLLGKNILSLWGNSFVYAYPILIILSIGQFFNISTGCSGVLLTMTGHEKVHGYISLSSLLINIILNIILITYYGAVGAAIATAITISLENITKLLFVKKLRII
jgi:O-antigen/teichoic acid export membrane protein